MYNVLKQLVTVHGISGKENKVAEKINEMIIPYVDEAYTDALGNLIAVKKCGKENAKKVMLCAHTDEIGFIVNFIEDNGYIRVATVGGISFTAAAYAEVRSEKGVVGVLVPNDGTKAADFKADNFYIDIGASSKAQAERRVRIGDAFSLRSDLGKLSGKRVFGRPIDDRIGCAVMVEMAKDLASTALDCDVYYAFTVQEEVGCRGSKTASFAIAPDYALVFDVTGTGDASGAKPMAVKLGGGAAIKIKDSSVICDTEIVAMLEKLAKEKNIKSQLEILTYGGTDTSSIQMNGFGCKAGALSIPSRYIHSGVEVIDMKDAEACRALAVEFIKNIKG